VTSAFFSSHIYHPALRNDDLQFCGEESRDTHEDIPAGQRI
jgi:hypothetical protein